MRFWVAVLVGACSNPTAPVCGGWDEVFVYVDGDADGIGADPVGWVCGPDGHQSVTSGDCDDGDPTSFPGAEEGCDGIDNDCDGRIDDGIALVTRYEDNDGDTFGGRATAPSCAPVGVAAGGDCDDDDADVNPLVREVCNGVDDDCDGRTDDDDRGVDPTTRTPWYPDTDADGWGDEGGRVEACSAPDAVFVAQPGDCDDARPNVHPGGSELCNGRDDDCDTLVDDADDSVDPASQDPYFADLDEDGYGDATALTLSCAEVAGAVRNGDDCDDAAPGATVVRDWFDDGDLDGVGAGPAVTTACHGPGGGTTPTGDDCDDADPLQFPGNPEVCEDGFDQDCTGDDLRCAIWMYTVRENSDVLERIDVRTNRIEVVGPLGLPFTYGDLAYVPESRTLYALPGSGAQDLYTVDLLTGAATVVGTHGQSDMRALAWDSSTGTLYAARFWNPHEVFVIDPATAALTSVGDPGFDVEALGYDSLRDQLIGMDLWTGDLYTVDRTTGAGTFLANDGPLDLGGVAYVPSEDALYVMTWGSQFYRYDPNDGYRRTLVSGQLPTYGGLAYVPDPPNP